MTDNVNHPKHYTSHPSGVEAITIAEHYNFNVGNAIKYLFRAGLKTADPTEDLKKARWYVRELQRIAATSEPVFTDNPGARQWVEFDDIPVDVTAISDSHGQRVFRLSDGEWYPQMYNAPLKPPYTEVL